MIDIFILSSVWIYKYVCIYIYYLQLFIRKKLCKLYGVSFQIYLWVSTKKKFFFAKVIYFTAWL